MENTKYIVWSDCFLVFLKWKFCLAFSGSVVILACLISLTENTFWEWFVCHWDRSLKSCMKARTIQRFYIKILKWFPTKENSVSKYKMGNWKPRLLTHLRSPFHIEFCTCGYVLLEKWMGKALNLVGFLVLVFIDVLSNLYKIYRPIKVIKVLTIILCLDELLNMYIYKYKTLC